MKTVILRVSKASVFLPEENKGSGSIGIGLVVFVGINKNDTVAALKNMTEKIANLRIFEDENKKLNYSARDKNYEILCVPNFTLCANISKGRRPSFENAMPQNEAKKNFEDFVTLLKAEGLSVKTGEFGKNMLISTDCMGPVNITIEA